MQYHRFPFGSEIQLGQLLSFSIAYPVVFNAAACATWHVTNSSLLLCCALISCSSVFGVMRHDCHEDAYYREMQGCIRGMQWRLVENLRYCSDNYNSIIIQLIICYILHRYLMLSSLSQVIRRCV